MKKLFKTIILFFIILFFNVLIVMVFLPFGRMQESVSAQSWLRQSSVFPIVESIGKMFIDWRNTQEREIEMQIVYQLAKRSIVKVVVGDAAGSGVIWDIGDDRIVVAANKHLLMKGVSAEITFCSNDVINAAIMGFSQQYDIGYLSISSSEVSQKALRDIYEAVPVLYHVDIDWERDKFVQEYAGTSILQIGADLGGDNYFFRGTLVGVNFEPLFNTHILKADCYSRAGMSGGGIFDTGGRLLGMISGGDVPEEAKNREAETTYGIPAWLIEEEYLALLADLEGKTTP